MTPRVLLVSIALLVAVADTVALSFALRGLPTPSPNDARAIVEPAAHWRAQGTAGSPSSNTPVTLIVLVDVSESSTLRTFIDISSATDVPKILADLISQHFIARLPPSATVAIGVIARPLTLSAGLDASQRDVRSKVRATLTAQSTPVRRGPSPVWDALDDALTHLQAPAGRAAIILLTDGEATGNTLTVGDVQNHAVRLAVPVHVVSTGIDLVIPQSGTGTVLRSRPTVNLRKLADVTGGLFLQAAGAEREYRPKLPYEMSSGPTSRPPTWDPDPRAAFEQIADTIRQTYTTATPSATGASRNSGR